METRVSYELWDVPSRNLIGAYHSKRDALAAVQTFIADDGEESIRGVALVRTEPNGHGGVVAEDADLVRMAREMRATRERIA